MSNWNDIPLDLAAEIAKRLDHYEDLETFSQVCRTWRQSKSQNYVVNRPTNRQTPWLMIPDPHPGRFYSLYTRMVLPIEFHPIALDEDEDGEDMRSLFDFRLDYNEFEDEVIDLGWKHLSSKGWLILVREGFDIVLHNPFTKRIIQTPQFPNMYKVTLFGPGGPSNMFILCHKAVLSKSPEEDDCFTLALLILMYLVIWNSKHDKWEFIYIHEYAYILDILFFKGELYAIDTSGKLFHCLTRKLIVDFDDNWDRCFDDEAYMVESAGRLLVLYRFRRYDDSIGGDGPIETWDLDYETTSFKVWEVNVDTGEYTQLQSIGDHAIFVGFNSSISVEVVSSATNGCKPNCIYFADDFYRSPKLGKDMGIYDLASRKVLEEEIYSRRFSCIAPPVWLEVHK